MVKALCQKDNRCLVCERRCRIGKGKKGHCRSKINDQGVIYTLNYNNVSSISVNPIEKKPFFHFYPGTQALTVGFWSCNFDCPWCQNYDISKVEPETRDRITPQEFVNLARANACHGTSLSFNEPTLFAEWGVEVLGIAREHKLYNTIVTNGYMTSAVLQHFIDAGLDAANVDIKGDAAAVKKYCRVDVKTVWRNCGIMKKQNVHLEITTLVIPTVNDDLKVLKGIGKRILNELGDTIPWHLTRYFPAYKFTVPATPIALLEDAHAMARELGIPFVYLGNIPGHEYENTYCPQCGNLLIKRSGMAVAQLNIDAFRTCPQCHTDLSGYLRL
jgi:pyruvate formate lyase activating enzyme